MCAYYETESLEAPGREFQAEGITLPENSGSAPGERSRILPIPNSRPQIAIRGHPRNSCVDLQKHPGLYLDISTSRQ